MSIMRLVLAALLSFFSVGFAFAADPATVDLSSLTSQISFVQVTVAVLGVYALIIPFVLSWKGGQKVIQAIRRHF